VRIASPHPSLCVCECVCVCVCVRVRVCESQTTGSAASDPSLVAAGGGGTGLGGIAVDDTDFFLLAAATIDSFSVVVQFSLSLPGASRSRACVRSAATGCPPRSLLCARVYVYWPLVSVRACMRSWGRACVLWPQAGCVLQFTVFACVRALLFVHPRACTPL
jgi:hypothetical protein